MSRMPMMNLGLVVVLQPFQTWPCLPIGWGRGVPWRLYLGNELRSTSEIPLPQPRHANASTI